MIQITDRAQLLAMLGNAVNSAAKSAIRENRPIVVSKRNTLVGTLSIEKTTDNTYLIKKSTVTECLYTSITLYESAVLIAQSYLRGDVAAIKEIVEIDCAYTKHHTDMLHHLSCYRALKLHNNLDRMVILEDKFYMSEELSKLARSRLAKFKRLQPGKIT